MIEKFFPSAIVFSPLLPYSILSRGEVMLYHKDVYFPATLELPRGIHFLYYSNHAHRAARSDRYGHVNLPAYIDTRSAIVIEVETNEYNKVKKIVYRQKLDATRDICLAVAIEQRWEVKTVWVNLRSDTHSTLNRRMYARR